MGAFKKLFFLCVSINANEHGFIYLYIYLSSCCSRFGSLVEVYLVPGRNVGYIKYSDRKHANDAMSTLHGKVVNGVKMKVMLADPPKEESHKRQRTY